MRLRHLLGASLLCYAGMAGARDVHGVDGYYNWTAAQMQANALMDFGPEGKQWAQWYPSFKFEGGLSEVYPGGASKGVQA